ncbi:MAG: ATP-binding cassette domain-containing protein, partial [bacterium]
MADIVLSADRLSKRYVVRHERNQTLKETFLHRLRSGLRRGEELFWALRDVSFSLKRGMALGIIGGNGSGKSTLLKIVAGITPPTSGTLEARGSVLALLELGAGFHPDLTGLENIYLNGSLLGLAREDVDRKLERIVAFAELEPFLSLPVKHYSSGMYVRLGFSLAVHLEPDVLA